MTGTHREINAINAGTVTLLVTLTSGGTAIHLTREAEPEEPGRSAVPEHYLDDSRGFGYDLSEVVASRWAEATLCGRPWVLMAEGDADEDDATAAPSCRRCLALMDKLFPPPELDDKFPLVVQLVADTIIEHGYAEIRSVPGDQQLALRSQVRAEVRRRTGHGPATAAARMFTSMVIFVCEPIHAQHAAEMEELAREAMSDFLNGVPSRPVRRPWRLSWETWATEN
jgi:hypothetical protein